MENLSNHPVRYVQIRDHSSRMCTQSHWYGSVARTVEKYRRDYEGARLSFNAKQVGGHD